MYNYFDGGYLFFTIVLANTFSNKW